MAVLSTLQILTLQSLPGVGPKAIIKVATYLNETGKVIASNHDLVPILECLGVKMNNPEGKGKVAVSSAALNIAEKTAERIIEYHNAKGIGITSLFEPSFPDMLKKTVNEDGKPAPPLVIYYKGDLSITSLPGLAVIGTREITDFGENAGIFLSKEFAKKGFCIVSGLAIGCDTVGHKGALAVGGKTIAFLAHGLDSVYPPENEQLANDIVEHGGLLMSEYPLGTSVNRYNLVARDRLQAGMSKATLVIQTGEHGGTMHAANTTLADQKPLYVVKFKNEEQNNHEKSRGNALLVKKGAKYLSGSDNLEEIAKSILNYQKPVDTLF